MYIKSKRGQSTVEYVLLVTAVIAVLIAFFANGGVGGNGFSNQLNSALNGATSDIGTAVTTLSASHAPGAATNDTLTTPYNIDVTNGV